MHLLFSIRRKHTRPWSPQRRLRWCV